MQNSIKCSQVFFDDLQNKNSWYKIGLIAQDSNF